MIKFDIEGPGEEFDVGDTYYSTNKPECTP